jgi:hypothetical protein
MIEEVVKTRAFLTLVVDNVLDTKLAHLISKDVLDVLTDAWKCVAIEPYTKFEHSYKIELELLLTESNPSSRTLWAIAATNTLASPWLVYYDEDRQMIELIFNKTDQSHFADEALSTIVWAHFQFE